MADVVEQCVRGMLGDIGPREVFQQRVRHLLRNSPAGSNATLHVCPAKAHLAQAVIAEMATAAGGELSWLSIYSDEQCAPDTLVRLVASDGPPGCATWLRMSALA